VLCQDILPDELSTHFAGSGSLQDCPPPREDKDGCAVKSGKIS
jgi:hypothetical protein